MFTSLNCLLLVSIANADHSHQHSMEQISAPLDEIQQEDENIQSRNDFKMILSFLSYDWAFIQRFLNNPEKTLGIYEFTDEQRQALITIIKDAEILFQLGLNKGQVMSQF